MKVIKVIVDELPAECGECPFCDFSRDYDREAIGLYCRVTNKSLDNEKDYEDGLDIPRWCPLITDEEYCEWLIEAQEIESEEK